MRVSRGSTLPSETTSFLAGLGPSEKPKMDWGWGRFSNAPDMYIGSIFSLHITVHCQFTEAAGISQRPAAIGAVHNAQNDFIDQKWKSYKSDILTD